MKTLNYLLFILLGVFSLVSCTKEFGNTKVTYTKATPIYLAIDEVRHQNLNEAPRTIIDAGKIFVGNDYILVGEENVGIHVIDNIDPANPNSVHFINIPGNREFYVDGDFLYANNYFDLIKIDITDVRNAVIVERMNSSLISNQDVKLAFEVDEKTLVGFEFKRVTEEVAEGTSLWDHINNGQSTVYFNYYEEVIPPSSIPSSFAGNSLGEIGTTNRMSVVNDQLYILFANGIRQYDQNLQVKEHYDMSQINGLETLIHKEGKMYVGSQTAMLKFRVEDNGNLVEEGTFFHSTSCDPVYPQSDELAYVTVRAGGPCPGDENMLYVVSTEDSNHFTEIASVNMNNPMGMTIVGDHLVVAEGKNGFTIFDITTPTEPKKLYSETEFKTYDVLASPFMSDVFLVADGDFIKQFKKDSDGVHYSLVSEIRVKS